MFAFALISLSFLFFHSFRIADDGEPFTFQGIVLDIPWQLPKVSCQFRRGKKEEEEPKKEKEEEEEKKEEEEEREEGKIRPSDLTSSEFTFHQLGDPRLLKRGFLFVWVDKTIISECLVEFEKLGFFYVENACCKF